MARFAFRFLTPLMFAFAVMMYFSGFRLIATAFAAAGCISYFIAQELSPRR